MENNLESIFATLGIDDAMQRQDITALLRRAGALQSVEGSVAQYPSLPSAYVLLDPMRIQVDAGVYQFRSKIDHNGVTQEGECLAKKWDPILHGDPLLVHQRLDGRLFVADGHHRLDLAKRLHAQGLEPKAVAVQVLSEADGYTAHDVKIIAAYKNLQHGTVDPVDAAKVLKEARKTRQELLPELPMEKGTLPTAALLTTLSEPAFSYVETGAVPVEMGAEVAKRSTDGEQQTAVMKILTEKRRATSYRDAVKCGNPDKVISV